MPLEILERYDIPCGGLNMGRFGLPQPFRRPDKRYPQIELCPEALAVHADDSLPPVFPIVRHLFQRCGRRLHHVVYQSREQHPSPWKSVLRMHDTKRLEVIELDRSDTSFRTPSYLILVHIPIRGYPWYQRSSIQQQNRECTKEDIDYFYTEVLRWADAHNIRSISFPLMVEWIFTPKEVEQFAITAINNYLESTGSFLHVYLIVPPERPAQTDELDLFDRLEHFEATLERQQIRSGKTEEEYRALRRDYYLFQRLEKPAEVAELIDYHKSNFTKLRSKTVTRPRRKDACKIAVGLGLSAMERFELMRLVFGYENYPAEPYEYALEQLLPDDCADFARVNLALWQENPDYAFREPLQEEIKRFEQRGKNEI